MAASIFAPHTVLSVSPGPTIDVNLTFIFRIEYENIGNQIITILFSQHILFDSQKQKRKQTALHLTFQSKKQIHSTLCVKFADGCITHHIVVGRVSRRGVCLTLDRYHRFIVYHLIQNLSASLYKKGSQTMQFMLVSTRDFLGEFAYKHINTILL